LNSAISLKWRKEGGGFASMQILLQRLRFLMIGVDVDVDEHERTVVENGDLPLLRRTIWFSVSIKVFVTAPRHESVTTKNEAHYSHDHDSIIMV
jgi:hypothetical protein